MRAGNRSIATGIVWTFACISAAAQAMPVAQAGASFAQAPEARPTVDLTMDDKHVIKEFTLDAPDAPKVPGQIDLAIGTTLPADMPLQPFPPEAAKKVPKIKAHQFFVLNDRIFVVDPTRTIAEIIERDKQ